MSKTELLSRNRVILCHFDDYSHALLFPRWNNNTLLWPEALPASATPMPAPTTIDPMYVANTVKQAMLERCGLNPDRIFDVIQPLP